MKNVDEQKLEQRIESLRIIFENNFENKSKYLFSSPGRIEIAGNHTDHNNGCVVAAAINLDSLAIVSKTDDMIINFISSNLNQHVIIDLNDLKIKSEEIGQTSSLIRGIAAKLNESNYKIGGFNCVVQSEVAIGSGLSSSASIEILVGEIFNYFFNNDEIDPIELAKIGQYAENVYFGKPCGLMDQLAISYGGVVGIDFKNLIDPKVKPIQIDSSTFPFAFIIVNAGGSHADLTDDYASIPKEMKSLANYFGKSTLREIDQNLLLENIIKLREIFGDRVILRSLHFIDENNRAIEIIELLNKNDLNGFINRVNEAGNSSIKWLQNAYSIKNVNHQGINLAVALTENFLKQNNTIGAVKVHGGGFAGTILAIISNEFTDNYISEMQQIFGDNSVTKVSIRNTGAKYLKKLS